MALTKILKNTSGATRNILNIEVLTGGSYTLPHGQWAKAADSDVLLADISSGAVTVNNGTSDLSVTDALIFIKKFQDFDAASITFNNSGTGLSSTNVQDGLAEVQSNISANNGRFCLSAGFDGSASTGRYLEWNTNVASNYTAFNPPKTCYLNEISFASNGNCTTTINILKNGTNIQSITCTSDNKAQVISLNHTILKTDQIRVMVSSGSSSRPMIYLFFSF